MYSADDIRFMKRCLELARRGSGRVSPNPMVGCVIVNGGRVVAEGYHRTFGGPHAEVVAACAATPNKVRGATVYVNLEPCSHYGKTPPCAAMLAKMGVRRVICSLRDPNPCVNGRGIAVLRRAGVRVDVGLLSAEAETLNRRYLLWMRTGRPFVTLKAAVTLDGKTATATGESRWITSAEAREHARRIRAMHDAVIVGARTAATDDPLLTARGYGRDPLRVVIGSADRLQPGLRLCDPGGPPTLIASPAKPAIKTRTIRTGGGAAMLALFRGRNVSPERLLHLLGDLGVSSVFVEGGGETAWHIVQAGLVDEFLLYVAPKVLGGSRARTCVGGDGFRTLADALPLSFVAIRRIGPDVLVVARPRHRTGATTRVERKEHACVHRSH